MVQKEVRVAWQPLREFTKEAFIRAGVPPEDAEIEADVLIWANLRGVDSHGVQHVLGYVENLEAGHMNAKPSIQVLKETPATLAIDVDHGLGPIVTVHAMNRAMEKAKHVGIGWVLIRNVTHQGAMGYYSLMAAKEGMAGICFCCAPPNMAPFGARAPGVHNSPIAFAMPSKRYHPPMLDMATSVRAGGWLAMARQRGVPIPDGWALDKDGHPTTDPNTASILLPFGGAKGSGLAFMFESLSSMMLADPFLGRDVKVRMGTKQHGVVAAINVATFTDVDEYKENVDTAIDSLKALPPAQGFSEVCYPGEPEYRTYEERKRDGIPLPERTIANLRSVADRFSLELPPGL